MDLYVKLMGGLGNQMFQYAKGLSALEQAPQYTNLVLDCSFYEGQERKIIKHGLTGRGFDLDIFNLKYKRCDVAPIGGHILEGWFQSLEDFDNVIEQVREQFTFASAFPDNIEEMRSFIKNTTNSVSIHVRRGDFITNPTAFAHNEHMGSEYYRKAMDVMEDKYDNLTYFVFSEDMEWCRKNINNDKHSVIFIGDEFAGDRDTGHFSLMQQCENHIIANSTYSWWAAFLGQSKVTVGPKKWFTNESDSETMLDNWIKL